MTRLWLRWWRQPDQFAEMSYFIHRHGLTRASQYIMAGVSFASALVPITALVLSPHAPGLVLGAAVVATLVCLGVMGVWLASWPTQRQSQVLTLIGVLGIASWAAASPTPGDALLACAAFTLTGTYLAFFHTVKLLVLNVAVAVGSAAAIIAMTTPELRPVLAASGLSIVLELNVFVPVAVRGMSRALTTYIERSATDPLTGLLNRRGFADAVTRQLPGTQPPASHLVVILVDLDDFKKVNDVHGHTAGDDALRDVASVLRRVSPVGAAVCRAGGEEFLVAYFSPTPTSEPVDHRICAEIADLPHALTASVGTSCAELAEVLDDPRAFLDDLMHSADSAMYVAKRQGGNRAVRRAHLGADDAPGGTE